MWTRRSGFWLLASGLGSVTSIVLTYRVLARKVAAALRARFATPNDDLTLEVERT
jgi:hypothetical protein